MDTLHAVICILAGAVVSLVLSPMMLKPLDSHNRTAMNIAVCIVSAAILVAGGILIWIIWGVSAVAYLVGVLLVFLPYVKTPSDRKQENTKTDSE